MRLIETVFLTIIVTVCNIQCGTIDDSCLSCICQVESNCRPSGCEWDVNSLSCGYFQIKKEYYIDCYQQGKQPGESVETAWKRCANNYECASSCVRAYMNRYASRCQAYPTCEVFARVHNGGPMGCRRSSTNRYWNRVRSCYYD